MSKFPADVPLRRVVKALESLGFRVIREGNHVSMERVLDDGRKTPLTMPNHRTIKSSTLHTILTQVGVSREDFLSALDRS